MDDAQISVANTFGVFIGLLIILVDDPKQYANLIFFCRQEVVLTEGIMTQVDWYIEGAEFRNCNCDYACPCQFESPRPMHKDCHGFEAFMDTDQNIKILIRAR